MSCNPPLCPRQRFLDLVGLEIFTGHAAGNTASVTTLAQNRRKTRKPDLYPADAGAYQPGGSLAIADYAKRIPEADSFFSGSRQTLIASIASAGTTVGVDTRLAVSILIIG